MNWEDLKMADDLPASNPAPKLVQEKRPQPPKRPWGDYFLAVGKQTLTLLFIATLAYGSYRFFSQFVLQSVQVVGSSMTPTLQPAKNYLLDRWTYYVREPQQFDVVVLRDPEDDKLSVKRIIGCGGDSIYLKHGRVFLNGRELDEPYLKRGTVTYGSLTQDGEQWVLCGKDYYFLLGDNRNNSADSRVYGPVRRENLVGTVLY